MSWSLQELIAYIGIAYFVSWGFFFITLPLFLYFFGKVKGSAITYGLSWIVMLGITWYLKKMGIDMNEKKVSEQNGFFF